MARARRILETLAILNVDVVLIYASIALFTILTFDLMPARAFAILLANTGFIIASYMLNVIADHAEDAVNGRAAVRLSPSGVKALSAVLLIVFIATYTKIGGPMFFAASLLMAGASVWYSFPQRFRLKNVFLVKNLIPSACWAFSLAALFYLAGGMYFHSLGAVIVGYLPLFALFFAFEIMWDLPDREGDMHAGVRTLPTMIGFWWSKIAISLLFCLVLIKIPGKFDAIAVCLIIIFVLFIPERTKKTTYHAFLTTLLILAWIGYVLLPQLRYQVNNHTAAINTIASESATM